MRRAVVLLGLLLGGSVLAQESPSFKLTEHTFNAGGSPRDGVVLTSASFQVSFSGIAQVVMPGACTSSSFALSGGFVGAYPPPGEVTNLLFTDDTTLVWDGERSVGVYHLYHGTVTNPFDPGYGVCQPPDLTTETTSFAATPAAGEALFVLLTAENRLGEEGTKGNDSSGTPRPNPAPCP